VIDLREDERDMRDAARVNSEFDANESDLQCEKHDDALEHSICR
jgi:hypothetical protein